MKMLESVTVKMLQTPTVLNNPEERIVTDRGMTSRTEKKVEWTSNQMRSLEPTVRYHKVPGTMATPSGTLGGVIRLGVEQEEVLRQSHPPYNAVT